MEIDMATVIQSALAATINRRGPEVYEQITQEQAIMWEMMRTNAFIPWGSGGYNLEFALRTGKNTTFAWGDYKTQQTLKEQDNNQIATLPTKYINGNITWYQRDEDANVGKERVYNFVQELFDGGKESAKEQFGISIWQDGSGDLPHGIMAVLGLGGMLLADGVTANPNYGVYGANTYATIDRSVAANSWFRARSGPAYTVNYQNGAPAVPYGTYNTSEKLVVTGGTDGGTQTLWQNCCNNGGGDAPNLGVTTQLLYNDILSQLQSKVQIQQNQKMVDAGFPNNFVYNGTTVLWDENAPTGMFAFLNTKHLNIRPIKGYDQKFQSSDVTDLAAVGSRGYTVLMNWAGNYQCTQPRKQGALTGKF
jgi:hypothetical protein